MEVLKNIKRPALRYHGGKWKLAPWIVSHFPPHTTYVEPFGGGASVLLRKQPSFIEVYNDISGLVVNFFRVLRDQPDELMRLIELTPYSRQEFLESQKACVDSLELARRFFVWSWQGRGRAGVQEPGGWRFMSRATRGKTPVDDWTNNQHLWQIVQRLKAVHIESDDAAKVIGRFDMAQRHCFILIRRMFKILVAKGGRLRLMRLNTRTSNTSNLPAYCIQWRGQLC